MRPKCSIVGCEAEVHGRGLCPKHYQLWLRNGQPIRQYQPTVEERFWSKVDRQSDGCWLWHGSIKPGGYGNFGPRKGVSVNVHRFAYELEVGPIPDGHQIDHICHDPEECSGGPSCRHRRYVNPAHLKAVLPRENVLRGNGPPAINATKNHCPRGHEYVLGRSGFRSCNECARLSMRRVRERRAATQDKPQCVDCAAEVWWTSTRCSSCAAKRRWAVRRRG